MSYPAIIAPDPRSLSVAAAEGVPHPYGLIPRALWFETTAFASASRLYITATFTNDDPLGRPMEFAGHTFQLWSLPSFISRPTLSVEINEEPSGRVGIGQSFAYDFEVDVSQLPVADHRLAFRGLNRTSGIILPDRVALVAGTCASV